MHVEDVQQLLGVCWPPCEILVTCNLFCLDVEKLCLIPPSVSGGKTNKHALDEVILFTVSFFPIKMAFFRIFGDIFSVPHWTCRCPCRSKIPV